MENDLKDREAAALDEIAVSVAQGDEKRIRAAQIALSRVYRDQGRYAEALAIDPKPSRVEGWRGLTRHDDDFECGCEDTSTEKDGRRVRRTRWRCVAQSPIDEPEVPVWQCDKCGFVNITNETPPGYLTSPEITEVPPEPQGVEVLTIPPPLYMDSLPKRADDDFNCGCQDDVARVPGGRRALLSRWQALTSTVEEGVTKFLWKCKKCDFRNLSPLVPPGYGERRLLPKEADGGSPQEAL